MKNISKLLLSFLIGLLVLVPSLAIASSSYYTNVSGAKVHVPIKAEVMPKGVSARCKDGSYSFSQHRSGTCSGHKGVSRWL